MTPPPPVQWRNPRGVVVALIVGAAFWSCACAALAVAVRIITG